MKVHHNEPRELHNREKMQLNFLISVELDLRMGSRFFNERIQLIYESFKVYYRNFEVKKKIKNASKSVNDSTSPYLRFFRTYRAFKKAKGKDCLI